MDITFILEFVVTLSITLITTFLLPYLRTKFGEEKITSAYNVIKILVNAVEQTTREVGKGQEKKQWVIDRLKEYNISIDEEKVDEIIESAVKEMNDKVGG